jgi:UDP-glucose:(heptosyl)LPS alpha-1,3-glucosyltransferase
LNGLKIALLVHDYNRHGGHARYVAELSQSFKKNNDIHVFASVWEEPDQEKITFHHVPSWRKSALTSILSFCLPVTLMVRNQFDLIHSQGFTGFKQDVVTAHICHRAWYDAMERHMGKIPLKKRINKVIVCLLESWLFKKNRSKAFIAVSNRTKRDLLKHHGITKCKVIHHGVDCDNFTPANQDKYRIIMRGSLGIGPDEVIYLYVGDWQKAGLALVRALAKVSTGRLVVVSKSKTKEIERDAKNAGVKDRVLIIPGSLEIQRYYALSDIFVFPSYHDSFGMVVTEAMASGLPVICSAEAGASELIQDGISGVILQKAWDIEEISQKMLDLAMDPSKRSKIAQIARIEVEKYSWKKCADETMLVYREVAKTC